MISVGIEKDPKPCHHTLSKFQLHPFFSFAPISNRNLFWLLNSKNQFPSGVEDPGQNYYYHGKQKSSFLAPPFNYYKLNKSPQCQRDREEITIIIVIVINDLNPGTPFLGGSSLPDPRSLGGTGKREKNMNTDFPT
ncbi:hypothetical protein CEXT_129831 [Caerostris extrusa]|uniref:Uncharacterized protein n=1 Tax=Caerostris extrusa TaxID=172846 RepID=A0AAV4P2I4_CAEEX|nr:hypothetical protein CEXT_129831 [Caerostris extrusa]